MMVYVVMVHVNYGDEIRGCIDGVFSTKDGAKRKAKRLYKHYDSEDGVEDVQTQISEKEVDDVKGGYLF